MNESPQDLLQSRTAWGVLVSAAAIILLGFGIDIGDQARWVEAIVTLVGLGFAVYALWGRTVAEKPIATVAGSSKLADVAKGKKPPIEQEQHTDYP